jgi:hypothetical protein
MHSNVRAGKPLSSSSSHTLSRDTYTAGFGQPPWPLAVLFGPAEENTRCYYYVLPVRLRFRTSVVPRPLLFDTVTLGSHNGVMDSRLLDAPPNTLLLPLASTLLFFSVVALFVFAFLYLDRISLWHFDRYTIFPLIGMPCEAPCNTLRGVKRFLHHLGQVFRVV